MTTANTDPAMTDKLPERARVIAMRLEGTMRCNCDLDNWEPERSTGHSHVCHIHQAAMRAVYRPYDCDRDELIALAEEREVWGLPRPTRKEIVEEAIAGLKADLATLRSHTQEDQDNG